MLTLRQPRGLTMGLANTVWVCDDGATTVSSTNATIPLINGKYATALGAQTNGACPTTDGNTGAAFNVVAINKGCALVWGCNAAGTLKLLQGPISDLDSAGNFANPDAPQFPYIVDDFVAHAYSIIKNGATGSNWTPGTSNWNATGITETTVDVSTLPDRPQIS